jgi:sugar fermentation stimulation protein A
VGINTAIPGKVVQEIFETSAYIPWNEFSKFKSEIKINDQTRLDGVFLDKNNHPKHYIEIKNATYVVGDFATGKGQASFPDGVTERGLKHLHELSALIKKGFSAELIFAVQRTDCQQFVSAEDIDPEYCRQLRKSAQDGLIITPMVFALDPSGVRFTGETLPVIL